MSSRKYYFRRILLSLLLFLPLLGWLLPTDYFDKEGLVFCPSKLFFDIECYGCGMTRAVMHFHNLDFGGAVYYNALVIGAYPFLLFLWGKTTWNMYKKVRTSVS